MYPRLESRLFDLYEILKGFEMPLDRFYESKKGFSDLEPLATSIMGVSERIIVKEEYSCYFHFFKFAISYLECACNYDDKTFNGIKKLSTGAIPNGESSSIISRMVEIQKDLERTKTEEKFYKVCIEEHCEFEKSLPLNITPEKFKNTIEMILEEFLTINNCRITEEMYENKVDGYLEFIIKDIRRECIGITARDE